MRGENLPARRMNVSMLYPSLLYQGLPVLQRLSLFLFFTVIVIYLFNVNHTVYSVVAWWVGLAGSVYGCMTLMPIFWHDSPFCVALLWSHLFCNLPNRWLEIVGGDQQLDLNMDD
jgi:hypothetical protein